MATITENIQTLRSIKSDIKNAITDKGGSVGNDFKTYAQAITNLPSGGGNEDLRNLIEKDITTLNIPEGTTTIGDYIFWNCPNLMEVKIPDTVRSIGSYSFYRCKALKEVKIPNTVTSIGSYSFYRCEALKEVKIPDTVATIGGQAFYDCWSISKVIIGSGVTSIQDWAFKHCFALNSITVLAATPPTLGSGVFDDTNNCPIYVPAASVDTYKTATNWSSYADRIFGIGEIVNQPDGPETGGGVGGDNIEIN